MQQYIWNTFSYASIIGLHKLFSIEAIPTEDQSIGTIIVIHSFSLFLDDNIFGVYLTEWSKLFQA